MSLKRIPLCIKNFIKVTKKRHLALVAFDRILKEIEFNDISKNFPKDYFFRDYEPLFKVKKIISNNRICFLTNRQKEDFYASKILKKLFEEKEIGHFQIPFSKFSGLTNSKADGLTSFENFKTEQYEHFLVDGKNNYKDYSSIRYVVFNRAANEGGQPIKRASILTWSNKIFADNSDRSHRFSLLCKLDEINGFNDSAEFSVAEHSINELYKNIFLSNYYGFIVKSKTALDIVKEYSYIKDSCCLSCKDPVSSDDVYIMVFHKNTFKNEQKVINVFLEKEHSIYLNDLLKKYCKALECLF